MSAATSRWRRRGPSAQDPKALAAGVDTTFLGKVVPEIGAAVPLLHDMSPEEQQRVVATAVQFMQGDASAAAGLKLESASIAVTATVLLLQRAVREHVKGASVREDLAALNFPEAYTVAIVDGLKAHRKSLQTAALDSRTRFPRVVRTSWRVDVAISSSAVARVMRPCILLQLTLSDGAIKMFEVPMTEFHKLRYSVAKALQQMGDVEGHPIMRLAFDLDAQSLDE